ncbi:MAG: hypothetical protein ACREDG_00465, partial [Methylocella sp.]
MSANRPGPIARAARRLGVRASLCETGRGLLGLVWMAVLLIVGNLPGDGSIEAPLNNRTDSIHSRHETQRSVDPSGLLSGFEKNLGQVADRFEYLSRAPGYTVYLAGDRAMLDLDPGDSRERRNRRGWLRMRFAGALAKPQLEGLERLPGRIHYLLGQEGSHTDIPRYRKVLAQDVYPGIDVLYHTGPGQKLEYDLLLHAGAEPETIRIEYPGAGNLALDEQGNLLIDVDGHRVRQIKPAIHQIVGGKERAVAGRYVTTSADSIGFAIAAYDRQQPLIID